MPQASFTQSFTKVYRKAPYPRISPLRPELSAKGKTVIVTGGHSGIGKAIVKSFAQAGAANIAIMGRREEVLSRAKVELEVEFADVKFYNYAVSINDYAKVEEAFKHIRANIAEPDVIVLCAAYNARGVPSLEGELAAIKPSFETNVDSNVNLILEMVGPSPSDINNAKVVIEVNSAAANVPAPQNAAAYGASKLAIARMLDIFQREADMGSPKWPRGMRFHSMPPGGVLTEGARAKGVREQDFPFDDQFLPGNFAVWLASEEAAFLKGRYVWCNWDAEELVERKNEIVDKGLLKLGPVGEAPYPVEIKLTGVLSEVEQIEKQKSG